MIFTFLQDLSCCHLYTLFHSIFDIALFRKHNSINFYRFLYCLITINGTGAGWEDRNDADDGPSKC